MMTLQAKLYSKELEGFLTMLTPLKLRWIHPTNVHHPRIPFVSSLLQKSLSKVSKIRLAEQKGLGAGFDILY